MRLPFIRIVAAGFALFFAAKAWAHPGHPYPPEEVDEFDVEAFSSAVAHPFTGLDHLLTMLVVGVLAVTARRGLGLAFVGAVSAGFVSGLVTAPWLLALSVAVMGGVLWKGPPMAKAWVWSAVLMAGLLHGGAHAGGMIGITAGLGLCAGTMAGVGLGAAVTMALRALPPMAPRLAGALVWVIGGLLTVARLFPGWWS